MKKISIAILLLFVIDISATACDICGCGVGNSYIGILPDFRKRIFGIRYRCNTLYSHIGVGGSTTYLTSKENYSTLELWGGWNIGHKFRLMLTVPYAFNERINQGNSATKNGLGDITLSGYYQLLNNKKQVRDKLLVQTIWLGAGMKLPTGRYNPADKSNANQNNNLFQLGTGSTDIMLNAMYDIRLQDIGINASASYKMNSNNRYDYRYGNKLGLNGQVYYKFRIKDKFTLAPNTGVLFEKAKKDKEKDITEDISGGRSLMGTVGVETSGKRISIGANFQTPLSQQLASGTVKARNRCMLHVSYTL